MPEFKFKLGDIVLLKIGIAECRMAADAGMARMPNAYQIVERLSQECVAGVQLQYKLGGREGWTHEEEVAAPSEFDAATHSTDSLSNAWKLQAQAKKAE